MSGYVAASTLKVTRGPQPERPRGLLASTFSPAGASEISVSHLLTPISSSDTSRQLLHSQGSASVYGSDKDHVVFTMGSGGLSHGASRSRSCRGRSKSTAAMPAAVAGFPASKTALAFDKSQCSSREHPRSLREVFAGPHANLAMLAAERSPSVETVCAAPSSRLQKPHGAATVDRPLCMLPHPNRPTAGAIP